MTASFIISLDFELMWGVRDHRSTVDYGDAVLGARKAIPRLLDTFTQYGVGATWATVGLLFARNQREMLEYAPAILPSYSKKSLDPYPQVRELAGQDEASAPHFFGRSLLDRIMDHERQEIACHTYSHYYGLEEGQTVDQFKADLAANIAIARDAGCTLQSIVFCRNQFSDAYIDAAVDAGLKAFRGNQAGYIYQSRPGAGNSLLVRGLRLADGAIPLGSRADFEKPTLHRNAWNIPASRFLRPWSAKSAVYSPLHIRRIKNEMTRAALNGRHYHLWWHPHNMGRNIDQNLAQLNSVLMHFETLRGKYGMESKTMAEHAEGANRDF